MLERKLSKSHYIAINCEPLKPRPNEILINVLKDINLIYDDSFIINKNMGEWTFYLY